MHAHSHAMPCRVAKLGGSSHPMAPFIQAASAPRRHERGPSLGHKSSPPSFLPPSLPSLLPTSLPFPNLSRHIFPRWWQRHQRTEHPRANAIVAPVRPLPAALRSFRGRKKLKKKIVIDEGFPINVKKPAARHQRVHIATTQKLRHLPLLTDHPS